jgi:uncharacterized protein
MIIANLISDLNEFFKNNKVHDDHGFKHALTVMASAEAALSNEPFVYDSQLDHNTRNKIIAAALLHDADDPKIFYTPAYEAQKKKMCEELGNYQAKYLDQPVDIYQYPNAYYLMLKQKIPVTFGDMIEVIYMISKVGASKNGNDSIKGPAWLAIPRDVDRIEAIGEIGIARADKYTRDVGRPIFNNNDPLVCNEQEYQNFMPQMVRRFELYSSPKGTKSETMIGHCYDKLFHIGKMSSGSKYLETIAQERLQVIKEWVFTVNTIRRDKGTDAAIEYANEWSERVCPKYFDQHGQDSPYKDRLTTSSSIPK